MRADLEDRGQPFVSVVVPVYNDARRIGACIAALLAQTYPADRYEVLIVDNGSTDATRAIVRQYPVALLVEDALRSSYAARNKGIAHARGAVIALTDSDCLPDLAWIEEGVRALELGGADLAGGNVRFVCSPRPTGAELYDALSNMQVEQYIRVQSAAVTANLFVRAELFSTLGLFPASMRSGGDIFWTRQATTRGYTLVYAPLAEVAHPTRRLGALLKKQYRVGAGHHDLRAKERAAGARRVPSRRAKAWGALKGFGPPSTAAMRQALRQRYGDRLPVGLWRVWAVAWLCRVANNLGNISRARMGSARPIPAHAADSRQSSRRAEL